MLGTCNAHLKPGQLALMEALGALGKPMAVAALRNPYDLSAPAPGRRRHRRVGVHRPRDWRRWRRMLAENMPVYGGNAPRLHSVILTNFAIWKE